MKLLKIELGQSVWLLDLIRPSGPPPLVEVIQKIVNRYKFQGFPSSVQELAANEHAFIFGKYRDMAIKRMAVYSDGVVVDTTGNVEDADAFLQDALDFLMQEYGYQIAEYPLLRKLYNSTLVVQLDIDLDKFLRPLASIAKMLSDGVATSSNVHGEYRPAGLYWNCDTSALRELPGAFKIERKVKEPFDANVYIASAPLKTKDHLALLENLHALV